MVTSTLSAPRKSSKKTGRGRIEPEVLYPLEEFKTLAGLGNHAMRTARRNGLFVRRANNRSYVLGRDYLEYLNQVSPKPESSSPPTPAADPATA